MWTGYNKIEPENKCNKILCSNVSKFTYNYFNKAGRKYPCAIPTFSSVPLSINFLQKTNGVSRMKVQVISMLCKAASFQLTVVVTLTDFL